MDIPLANLYHRTLACGLLVLLEHVTELLVRCTITARIQKPRTWKFIIVRLASNLWRITYCPIDSFTGLHSGSACTSTGGYPRPRPADPSAFLAMCGPGSKHAAGPAESSGRRAACTCRDVFAHIAAASLRASRHNSLLIRGLGRRMRFCDVSPNAYIIGKTNWLRVLQECYQGVHSDDHVCFR